MEDSARGDESSSSGPLNLSPPLSPRPPVPSWVSALAGRLIDGCNGLSMDTAAASLSPPF